MPALGIGATTAIFTVFDALLLRPLPYPEAERLAVVATTIRRERVEVRATSYPDFVSWRDENTVFEQIAARVGGSFSLVGVSEPERISGELVSASYFSLLGVRPIASLRTHGAAVWFGSGVAVRQTRLERSAEGEQSRLIERAGKPSLA